MKRKKWFSLVELLVVISILTILSTLMIKSLNKTLMRSKTISCQQNLRSLGQAASVFTDDNNFKLPSKGYYFYQNGRLYSTHAQLLWKFQIGDYVYGKDPLYYSSHSQLGRSSDLLNAYVGRINSDLTTKVFECPQASDLETDIGSTYQDIIHWRKGGYGWNSSLINENNVSSDEDTYSDASIMLHEIESPHQTILMADTFHRNVSKTFPQTLMNSWQMRIRDHHYNWHNNGINILWADLHVSNMIDEEIKLGQQNDENYYFRYEKD